MNTLLHLLPPETAHALSLRALRCGLGPTATPDPAALGITLFGKRFSNPIGLSAGADKKAEALPGWSRMGFGFVEAGTVTLNARAGNPKPRIWRLGNGQIVNWLGLPGDGLAPFVENLTRFQSTPERKKLIVGASLASPDNIIGEFSQLAAACAPLVDYLTINASCPNVAGHDDTLVQTMKAHISAAAGAAGTCPVLLKLGPTRDKDSLKVMVETAMSAGAAGFVLTNTVPYDKRDILGSAAPLWPQRDGQHVGGYSGPALLDVSCWMVQEARALLGKDIPIIGVGGIQSGADAVRVLRAGADAIQLYTGLVYRGKSLLDDIKKTLTN